MCAGERGSSTVLFVGNLSFGVDEDTLKECFPQSTDARVAKFPDTQKPRGFVLMPFDQKNQCVVSWCWHTKCVIITTCSSCALPVLREMCCTDCTSV